MHKDAQPVDSDTSLPALLLALFVLSLLLRLACFTGLVGSDDLGYSAYAQRIAEGRYALEYHHYAIRFGLIVPVGLLYKLFGLSEWSTIALPLFASSLSVVLLALIAAQWLDLRAGLVAGLLYATLPVQLRYATILTPEPVAECYVLLGVLAYVQTDQRAQIARGILTGVCVGLGYLTKEPALFLTPALLIHAAMGRQWRNAFGIAVGVATVVGAEHAYYLTMTGDILFRPHAMAVHNETRLTVELENNIRYRLFEAYPRMMIVPNLDFGIHSAAALALAAVACLRFRNDRRIHFLLLWAVIPWLYLNFGTSSFSQYISLPLAPRYIEFTYPPLILLAAWLIADISPSAIWLNRMALSSVAAIALVGIGCGLSTRGTGYRADQMAGLRLVTADIVQGGGSCVSYDSGLSQLERWRSAVAILTHRSLRECTDAAPGIIVREDRLGLPYGASIP